MKKLSVYMLAFAAMGLAMTSCNKDERTDYDNISVNVEENEIMNDVKIHQNGNSPVNYWDEGDRIRFIDQNGNGAIFAARTSTAIAHFQFIQNINTARAFDQDNGPIIGIFPWDGAVSARRIDLPTVQNSENGEIFKHFPLYAEEPLRPGYLFRNLCGVAKLNVTANVAIDSITITTEKYLNGAFNIDMTDPTEPMLVSRQSSHATKSVTLKLSNPQVPTNHFYRIALPPTTYNVFKITFYSGNTQYVKVAPMPIQIDRHMGTIINCNITGATFTSNPVGSVNGVFSVSANQTVNFAKGNLQYIATSGHPFWHFADNQWDYINITNQSNDSDGDRDLISWGANRYNVGNNHLAGNTGNAYTIWNQRGTYSYLPGTDDLAGINDWGNNVISNGGNAAGLWRTLTAAEWNYLLNTRTGDRFLNAELTVNDMTVKGLIIFPDGFSSNYAGCNDAEAPAAAIAYYDWVNLEAAGCVFLPIYNYGKPVNGKKHFSGAAVESYYWTATPDTDDEANAVKLSKTDGMSEEVISKRCGAYIRLVQNI